MKIMKRIMLALVILLPALNALAQFGTVVVFAPKGEKFSLYFGKNLQNAEPAARVETSNPGGPNLRIKVVFADPSIRDVSKLAFNKPGSTLYYKVEKTPKGSYAIESVTREWMDDDGGKNVAPDPAPQKQSGATDEKKAVSSGSGHSSPAECDNPMSDVDFAVALAGIGNHPFEGTKLSAAKKMAEKNCLYARQVAEVMGQFNTEPSRLSFAKFAWKFTHDRDSYDVVKDALYSQKAKDDLARFIGSKK